MSHEREDIDLNKAIKLFSSELAFIDSINPKPDIFVTRGIGRGIDHVRHAPELARFFTRLNNRQGEHRNNLEDPVAGLIRTIERHRIDDRAMPSLLSVELCRKTVQAVTLWEEGYESPLYWRRKLVSGIDHLPFIREMKRAKHIEGRGICSQKLQPSDKAQLSLLSKTAKIAWTTRYRYINLMD